MTDLVAIALIQTAGTLGVIVLTAIVNRTLKKVATKQEIIHKQIDGQQEALIELVKTSSKAEGHVEGRAEKKKEMKEERDDEDAKKLSQPENPTEVRIVNSKDDPANVNQTEKE